MLSYAQSVISSDPQYGYSQNPAGINYRRYKTLGPKWLLYMGM